MESKERAKQETVVLIPSLNPDEKLTAYVMELIRIGFRRILLVDDGSRESCQDIFESLAKEPEVSVLHHEKNRGKGRALKTGFAYCMEQFGDAVGVVTADSDGQHSPKDTLAVAEALIEHPEALILGTRNFDEEQVPFKSRYGNKITTIVFRLLYGKLIHDTQTGLRGIAGKHLPMMTELPGERFEYEIGMLIEASRAEIPLVEVPIETIYINDNAETHFHPVKDSLKIYGVMFQYFLKYTLSSLGASLIDILAFWIFSALVFRGSGEAVPIFLSTIAARVISSACNFFANRMVVFKASGNLAREAAAYYGLVVVQMLCCAGLVYFFTGLLHWEATLVKVLVDTCLFFVSFQIQHRLIFREKA